MAITVAAESDRFTRRWNTSRLERVRLGLDDEVRRCSVEALNCLLAHTIALRDAYETAQGWSCTGDLSTVHLMFVKHQAEQEETIQLLVERIHALGGLVPASSQIGVRNFQGAGPPDWDDASIDEVEVLIDIHEVILIEARPLAQEAADAGDVGSSNLIVRRVIQCNEIQSSHVLRELPEHGALK